MGNWNGRHSEGYGRMVREIRHTEAQERQEVAQRRSPAQQLAKLDDRLGLDTGAVKERTRLELGVV